ncbi:hypothetical protein EVAR_2702_1 [Eumeta japonica]|uniref:Uncharacterized protein n=1 Tax=Eumeta variegata TaxID=151549 RepID=A0A4C1SQG9_EUMVA|nr:hypothetical protein EVAR_2702_1 [Eumeta japonica]
MYKRGRRSGRSLTLIVSALLSDGIPRTPCHHYVLYRRAELQAVAFSTILKRRSRLYTSEVGVLSLFNMLASQYRCTLQSIRIAGAVSGAPVANSTPPSS